ncbi:MAG: hypothetical protein DKM50_13645 [Candidatus Margulisiibacteriota bacterium]|nr:MAG: hypothetical protein A2X43_05380 [Candidatus Margulisbacteria bacterium GWD2_39_127]OGI03425.1 MAG: hypothetical protein A2X42_05095 [Candidatus Margulisbacteria bacterium GWF2_38_17]PZM77249.1 MAG: hypothetical protein DKM50_13645 [Candidatus Margulisiibacteriota bacterium]HAR64473.1 hypothetical protein [Candidatus Margulisiibacteriota bacterium]
MDQGRNNFVILERGENGVWAVGVNNWIIFTVIILAFLLMAYFITLSGIAGIVRASDKVAANIADKMIKSYKSSDEHRLVQLLVKNFDRGVPINVKVTDIPEVAVKPSYGTYKITIDDKNFTVTLKKED